MKGNGLERTMGYIGSGAGLALFAGYGVLHGALIGGTAGLKAGVFFCGTGVTCLLTRITAGLGMVAGVGMAAVIFILGGYAAGRILGQVMRPAADRANYGLVAGGRRG
ncbi:MAG TPA: hypothetical protein VGK71_02265 [Nitrospirota bacterium]|jgi:apolipoprotein N-acyltransferase